MLSFRSSDADDYIFIGLSDIGHTDVFTWDDGTEVVFTYMTGFYYYGEYGTITSPS